MSSLKEKKNQQIQVFVRVRPINQQEKEQRSHSIVECCSNKEVTVRLSLTSKKFTFDRVFGPKSKQVELYTTVVSPLIKEVLSGYNCTVFAYGQTGTGKTYTMAGGRETKSDSSWQTDPEAGIIPRTLSHLFDELRLLQLEYSVRVSYLELYNEELFDLLSPTDDSSKIRLYEDNVRKGSVIIHGLEEVIVHNKNEVYKILQKGAEKRQTASTLMNAHSSRSHTVFSITVHTKDSSIEGEDLLRTGKLNLVDLAGSENIGRSGAIDKRAREAGNINQSLLTLGRVITALVERAPHIPYRESKLTRLLQDSLGGRTKTSIIATVSPALCNIEETLSTLEYAHRARNITNRPEINQRFTKATLLKQYTEEIERLRRDLAATRSCNGIFLAQENYQMMLSEIENYTQELSNKINEYRAVCDELDKQSDICNQLHLQLTETQAHLMEIEEKLKEKIAYSEEQAHLVDRYSKTEEKLGQQAKTLLTVVENVAQDTNKLHDKLDVVRNIEVQNKQQSKQFQNACRKNLVNMQEDVEHHTKKQKEMMDNFIERYMDCIQDNREQITSIYRMLSDLVKRMSTLHSDSHSAINHAFDINSSNSLQSKQTVENVIEHYFKTLSTFLQQQVLSSLSNYLKNSNEKVEMFLNNRQNLIDAFKESYAKVDLFVDESQKRIIELQNTILDLNKKHVETVRGMQENIRTKEEHNVKIDDILTQLYHEMTEQKEQNTQLNINLATAGTLITSVQQNIMMNTETEQSITNQYREQSKTLLNKHETQVNDISSILIENETKLQTVYEDLYKNIEETITNFETQKKNDTLQIQSELDNYFDENCKFIATQQQFLSEIHTQINHIDREKDHIHSTIIQQQNNDLTLWKENLYKLRQSDTEFEEKLIDSIHQRHNEIEKFFAEDIILQCQRTGQTPQRKELSYPRCLVSTSPKDVIIERFRKNREKRKLIESLLNNGELNENVELLVEVGRDGGGSVTEDVQNDQKYHVIKSASSDDVCLLNKENLNIQNSSEENLKSITRVKSYTDLPATNSIKPSRRILGNSNI